MSEYSANICWQRDGQAFTDQRYSRGHTWQFDGGLTVPASASPHIVPPPMSVEYNVDPEEAFVAALSSCHMLFFLDLAATAGYVVDSYNDRAAGVMEKGAAGKIAMTRVTLRPMVKYSGTGPSRQEEAELHHRAHERCFIANSVTTDVQVETGS